jgi:uncharacterized paraquat-inducible protein A
MTDDKGSGRIHIILDAGKVNRCSWCGSPVSEHWISSEGGPFCSKECEKEWLNERNSCTFCFSAFLTLLFLLLIPAFWLSDSSYIDNTLRFQVIASCSVAVVILSIFTISSFRDYNRTPNRLKDSQRNVGTSKASLLRSISTPVECPNCDALIDLTNIGEDMVYHCQYCGANGIIEIKIAE